MLGMRPYRPLWRRCAEIFTIGHEFSGKVVEVGEGVTDLEIGQHVVAEPILVDGTCHSCSKGLPRLCTKLAWIGYSGTGGGFADYVCVDRKTVHAIPNSIPLDVAALVEPLSVAWHAVKVSKIKPGESALVLGAGKSMCLTPVPN